MPVGERSFWYSARFDARNSYLQERALPARQCGATQFPISACSFSLRASEIPSGRYD